jgi:hypothetical protein
MSHITKDVAKEFTDVVMARKRIGDKWVHTIFDRFFPDIFANNKSQPRALGPRMQQIAFKIVEIRGMKER